MMEEGMTKTKRAKMIEDTVADLVASFLYYDRKEDEDLPRGEIEEALLANEITIDEIIEMFGNELRAKLSELGVEEEDDEEEGEDDDDEAE